MRKLFFFIFLSSVAFQSEAQFLNSIGITAGVSAGNQKFYFKEPVEISKKKYVFGFNASLFAEFLSRDYVRWISELQYNQKGSIDKQPEANYPNKLQYICWNNYLKIRYEMYSIIPYILIGPRLEYNLTQRTTSPAITSNFLKLHVSAAVGAGVELVSYSKFKIFIEGFYNPDVIMPAYVRPGMHARNTNFELRIGLKYEINDGRETCNTPVYIE
ncbi:MAG: outer membrane beta-barrel protein [Bacteroidota bacterium]